LLVGLALIAVFAWRTALAAPDGRMHITVLPCGENAVLYVRAPGGQTALLGGGEKTRDLASALGRRLRPLYPHIDLLVLPNGDKIAPRGLADLTGRITFGQVLLENSDLRMHEPLSRELRRQGAVFHSPAAGQIFDLGDGAELQVLVAVSSRQRRFTWTVVGFSGDVGGCCLRKKGSVMLPFSSLLLRIFL
jgi:hypothetical protein